MSEISTSEIDASEQLHGPFTDDVRRLIDVAIRTRVSTAEVERARALVNEAVELLGEDAGPGPAGIRFNAEGRSWNWGNAVVGVRNALAPPLVLKWRDDDSVESQVQLGAAYEGPPGCVHGGVAALMLDHLMGETASARHTRLTVTGTLTLRYVLPLPLGSVYMRAHIAEETGRKVTVKAHIGTGGSDGEPSIEAHGLFIVPRWAAEVDVPDLGSLD